MHGGKYASWINLDMVKQGCTHITIKEGIQVPSTMEHRRIIIVQLWEGGEEKITTGLLHSVHNPDAAGVSA